MASDLLVQLNTLVERLEKLSGAAEAKADKIHEATQNEFYTGVLVGLSIAREELSIALTSSITEYPSFADLSESLNQASD